ncbi:MAG: hypothetical protein CMD02_04005 [Flavobacteriales bacterium]|nr:hypothetical protein [Flavobacteriales bacterium]|tara:strand:- start:1345 stop:2208 length:864 start_codon:yes stop_codon:yes gene_type:complete
MDISDLLNKYSLSSIQDVETIKLSTHRSLWDNIELEKILPLNSLLSLKSALPKQKLSNFTSLRELDASTLNMEDINPEFFSQCSLEKFEFRNGKIRLQKSFLELKKLKEILFFDVKISSLPKDIGELKALENIRLGYTNIKKLPDSISNLQNLQSLHVWNKLETLENIVLPNSLLELDCRGSKITSIPEDVFKPSKLRKIDFGSNPITNIPLIKNENIQFFRISATPVGVYKANIDKIKKFLPNSDIEGGRSGTYFADIDGFVYLSHCKKGPTGGYFYKKDFEKFKI